MAIPEFQAFMLPLLRLAGQRGETSLGDAVELLAQEFQLSEEECNHLVPSGRQTTLRNRVTWAKTYLIKAGLLESTKRAHFRITPEGEAVLKDPKVQFINVKFLLRYPEFQKFRDGNRTLHSTAPDVATQPETTQDIDEQTPEEAMHAAHSELESALAQELLELVLKKSPSFFEHLVVRLLVAMGYGGSIADAGRALGKSGDGGVDGVIDQDALGLDRIYVQAKRYQEGNNVGSAAIRDFFGALDHFRASKGLFVTASSFTKEAQETAKALSKRIVLIDGERLARLMIRYNVGCQVKDTLHIKAVDEDFFE